MLRFVLWLFVFLVRIFGVSAQEPTPTEADPCWTQGTVKIHHPQLEVRLATIDQLSQHLLALPQLDSFHRQKTLPLLLTALSEDSLRYRAAWALTQVGQRFGSAVVDDLIGRLWDQDYLARFLAAEILGDLGNPQAILPLIQRLRDANPYVRGSAASSLGKLRAASAVRPLLQLLADRTCYRYARIFAAEALGAIGDPQALPGLLAALEDSEELVREAALRALGQMLHPLSKLLGERNSQTRLLVVRALEALKNPQSRDLLYEVAFYDRDLAVREAASRALQKTELPLLELGLQALGPFRTYAYKPTECKATVSNETNTLVPDVRLIYVLPPSMDYGKSSPPGRFDAHGQTVTWQLGDVLPKTQQTVSVLVRPARRSSSPALHVFRLLSQGRERRVDCQTQVMCFGGPHISSYDTDDPVEVGRQTTYVIEIRNEGTNAVTQVGLTNLIPEQMEFVQASGPTAFTVQGREIIFAPCVSLEGGEVLKYRITCRAVHKGAAKNHAEVRFAEFDHAIVDEEGTEVYE